MHKSFLSVVLVWASLCSLARAEPAKLDRMLAPYPAAISLRQQSAAASRKLAQVYGPGVTARDLPIVRAADFFFLRPWFRFRTRKELGEFAYNPIAIGELEGLKRAHRQCTFPASDGRFYTIWDTVERSSGYLTAILSEYERSGTFSWSPNYLSQPQIKAWFQGPSVAAWYAARFPADYKSRVLKPAADYYAGRSKIVPVSTAFDLDVLFSLHSAMMDGSQTRFKAPAKIKNSGAAANPLLGIECGGYGEFRVCKRPPIPEGAEREKLARRDLPLLREVSSYFEAWRLSKPLPADPIVLAAKVRKDLNTVHPFRDGNGRVSKMLTQLILQSIGLPPASVHLASNDALSLEEYTQEVRAGEERTIAIINSCADFLACAEKNKLLQPGDWKKMCELRSSGTVCDRTLLKIHAATPASDYQLEPCDCSLRWKFQEVVLPLCRPPVAPE